MNPFYLSHTFLKKPPPARRPVQLKARLPGESSRQVFCPTQLLRLRDGVGQPDEQKETTVRVCNH